MTPEAIGYVLDLLLRATLLGGIIYAFVWLAIVSALRSHYRWIRKRKAEDAAQGLFAAEYRRRNGVWPGEPTGDSGQKYEGPMQ